MSEEMIEDLDDLFIKQASYDVLDLINDKQMHSRQCMCVAVNTLISVSVTILKEDQIDIKYLLGIIDDMKDRIVMAAATE